MARAHLEYLQTQSLAWQSSPWPHLAGCHIKVLSRDATNGAASLLVRFPAGWQPTTPGCVSTHEQLFVLEGALELDGRHCGQDCFAWFPQGSASASRSTPEGAVALVFYDAEPTWQAETSGTAAAIVVDAYDMPWEAVETMPAADSWGPKQKILCGDANAGALTMLVAFPPHMHPDHWAGPQELHACTEELFLLSGDCLTNVGQMFPGAYFWRPPGIAHGPYGSRGGNLALLRIHGAPLATTRTSHQVTLARTPEYQPVLPRELDSLRTRPWRPQSY